MQTVGKATLHAYFIYYNTSKLLVLFSQQVIYSLNRIECAQRNFNEDSVPVSHSTIPEVQVP